jgi:hypothetical protein
MKTKSEKFVWIDPELPPEKQADIRKRLEQMADGHLQNEKGKMRQGIVDAFLELFTPEQVANLEEEIRQLHILKNPAKFRAELIILLVRMHVGGMLSDDSHKEEWKKLLHLEETAGGKEDDEKTKLP